MTLRYGLMSIGEMINCRMIDALCALGSQTMLYELVGSDDFKSSDPPDDLIDDDYKTKIKGWLKLAAKVADDFEWRPVHDRVDLFERRLERPITHRDVGTEMRVLRETLHGGLKGQLIYRYPEDKRKVLLQWKKDWALALTNFPSAERDVMAAVDLWALGHSTASVFHLMRVLEYGLRSLANDVGRKFELQFWQNVIDEIESEIRSLGKTLPRGMAKTERLQFLSEAAKEFVYFKDGWRNYVSHNRGDYDEHQARSVLEHVRTFMNHLASQLAE